MQISSCVVHESGALLIEPGGAAGYDMMLRRVAPRTSPSGVYHTPPVDPNAAGAAPGSGAPCQAPTPQLQGEAPDGAAVDAIAEGDCANGAAAVMPCMGLCQAQGQSSQAQMQAPAVCVRVVEQTALGTCVL